MLCSMMSSMYFWRDDQLPKGVTYRILLISEDSALSSRASLGTSLSRCSRIYLTAFFSGYAKFEY